MAPDGCIRRVRLPAKRIEKRANKELGATRPQLGQVEGSDRISDAQLTVVPSVGAGGIEPPTPASQTRCATSALRPVLQSLSTSRPPGSACDLPSARVRQGGMSAGRSHDPVPDQGAPGWTHLRTHVPLVMVPAMRRMSSRAALPRWLQLSFSFCDISAIVSR